MKNILDNIVTQKRKEVAAYKSHTSILELSHSELYSRNCFSLSNILQTGNTTGIIAEFKRKSPSKGLINIHEHEVSETTKSYQNAGASAVSILTDKLFFGAQANDFSIARQTIGLPILRKEFIIDPYQVYQSKAMGADLILLIGAVLSKKESQELSKLAHDLGLEVIYEIHSVEEIDRIPKDIKMVGINNRDLKYFKVDFNRSMRMFDQLPTESIKIAESGISDPMTVINLKKKGFNGFLIGETFIKANKPGLECEKFIRECQNEGI